MPVGTLPTTRKGIFKTKLS